MAEPEIRAAGGVVLRPAAAGGSELAVVHRPLYDDWSPPNGKLEPCEDWAAVAIKEVEEETGLRCSLVRELDSATYEDRHGRTKHVRWWEMRSFGGEFVANDEVDELRWLEPAAALALLDYEHDRALVLPLSNSRPGS